MTVGELIQLLEAYESSHEIRLASQPNWPFEYRLAGVASDEEVQESVAQMQSDERGVPFDEALEETEEPRPVVWLVEGSQEAYASKAIWHAAGARSW